MSIQTYISRQGYSVRKDSLSQEEQDKLKEKLTVSPFIPEGFSYTEPPKYIHYKESENKLYIPRFFGLKEYGVPKLDRLDEGTKINVKFEGSLRAEQELACNAFLEACKNQNKRGGILNLTCASGKTVMAIYLYCTLGVKTLILVHKDFLVNQWIERIQQFAPATKIGLIKAKTVDVIDKDVVIGSVQSISMKQYHPSLFQEFGFLISDETHHMSSEVFSQALQKAVCKYNLGLTATIKRKDGLTKVFKWYLGDVVFSNCHEVVEEVVNVYLHRYYDPNPNYGKEVFLNRNQLNISRMINNICEFVPRATLILNLITEILTKEPRRKILVLSDRKSLLELLMNIASKTFTCGYYIGGMKTEELKESESKQILLGTYAMVSEGFDVKSLDTLVLGSPKSDVIQSVGRILREVPEKRARIPTVIDIIDDFSIFAKQAQKRIKFYKSKNYKLIGDIDTKVSQKEIKLEGHQIINLE